MPRLRELISFSSAFGGELYMARTSDLPRVTLKERRVLGTILWIRDFEREPLISSGPFLDFWGTLCPIGFFSSLFWFSSDTLKGNKRVYRETWVTAILFCDKYFISHRKGPRWSEMRRRG